MIRKDIPFIDIHTHQPTGGYHTYGLHPWKLIAGEVPDLTVLERLLNENRIAAIGETGLDSLHNDTYGLQQVVFEQHILLSEQYQKPLIIHCVKATADILRFHKKLHPQQAWVIHGFNGNTDEIRQLTQHGIFLSVGESLFYRNRKITQSISSLPLDYLFLETDTSALTIEQIYGKASELLNIPMDRLKEQIFINFAKLWKTGNNAHDCSSATMALINWDEATC